jgi:Na+/phosphate symporter
MQFEHALLLHIFIINGEHPSPFSTEKLFAYLNQNGKIKREHFDYAYQLYEKYQCFSDKKKRKISQVMKEYEANEYWIQIRMEQSDKRKKNRLIHSKRYVEEMNRLFENTAA